jgi:hypothetical protein
MCGSTRATTSRRSCGSDRSRFDIFAARSAPVRGPEMRNPRHEIRNTSRSQMTAWPRLPTTLLRHRGHRGHRETRPCFAFRLQTYHFPASQPCHCFWIRSNPTPLNQPEQGDSEAKAYKSGPPTVCCCPSAPIVIRRSSDPRCRCKNPSPARIPTQEPHPPSKTLEFVRITGRPVSGSCSSYLSGPLPSRRWPVPRCRNQQGLTGRVLALGWPTRLADSVRLCKSAHTY